MPQYFEAKGRAKHQLKLFLEAALTSEYTERDNTPQLEKVRSWEFNKEKGLVLSWYEKKGTPFLGIPSLDVLTELVWNWLTTSEEAKSMELKGQDAEYHGDGSSYIGFRIKTTNDSYNILYITPSWVYYSK